MWVVLCGRCCVDCAVWVVLCGWCCAAVFAPRFLQFFSKLDYERIRLHNPPALRHCAVLIGGHLPNTIAPSVGLSLYVKQRSG